MWPVPGLSLPSYSTCFSNQLMPVSTDKTPRLPACLLAHSPACVFVCLPNQLESRDCHVGKWLTNCMLFSRWMWLLSHGDVTFQQEAQDETLSEDFVPPGCMAECWVQGCWPRHRFISTSAAAALGLAPCPSHIHSTSTVQPAAAHNTIKRWRPHYSFVLIRLHFIRRE